MDKTMTNLQLPNLAYSNLARLSKGTGWTRIAYQTYVQATTDPRDLNSRGDLIMAVRHFDTTIAVVHENGTVEVNNGGYASRTTTHRLDAILRDNRSSVRLAIRKSVVTILRADTLEQIAPLEGYRVFHPDA